MTFGFSRTGGGIFLTCFGDFGAISTGFKGGCPPTAENDLEIFGPVGVSLLSLPLPPLELNLTLDLFCLSRICRGGRLAMLLLLELIDACDEGDVDCQGSALCVVATCCCTRPPFQLA
jgi:hypothetical protein